LATQTSSFSSFSTLSRAGEYTSGGNAYRWANRTDAQTSNNVYASLSYSDGSGNPQAAPTALTSQTVNYFVVTGLSSTVPSGATINGITVKIERYNSVTPGDFTLTINDSAIYLTKDGSTLVGNNKSTGAAWQSSDNNTTVDFGGSADLWGTTLTAAEVNASTFGVMISPSLTFDNSENGSRKRIRGKNCFDTGKHGGVRRTSKKTAIDSSSGYIHSSKQ
jgi:hypothetical protein